MSAGDQEVEPMAWWWKYEPASSVAAVGDAARDRSSDFPAQAEAETWLGQEFQSLLDAGVAEVTLMVDEREVYGPMSLRP